MSGGGGNSGGGTTTTTQKLNSYQKAILNPVIPIAQDFVNNPPTLFPGSAVAGFNPTQQAAQQSLLGAVGGQQQLANSARDFTNFTFGPGLDPNTNPGLQGAIQAATQPISDTLTQQILPQLRTEASVLGQPGSSRAGIAEGLASQGALREIGNATANVVNPAYQAGLEAASRSLAVLPTTQQAQIQPGLTQDIVGSQQQGLQQARLSEQARNYGLEQILPFMAAQEAANLAFGIPGGTSIARATGATGNTNPLLGGLGGAATGAALGSMFAPGPGTAIGGLLGGIGGAFFQ